MRYDVSLRHMRYFVAVAEERSFRAAAQRLHITQPPLSRAVADLECELGVVLLRRDSRSVRLTAAGTEALAQFRGLLAQAERVIARVAALREALPTMRLGLLNWLDINRLPALEDRLRRTGLVAGVECELLPSHEAVTAVQRGSLDAALVVSPIEARGLRCTKVAALALAAWVPASSTLARRRVLSLNDLNGTPPFYRFRRSISPLLYDHLNEQYLAHGFVPVREAPANDVMDVLARIGAGQGATCIPDSLAVHRYAGVVRRPLRERVTVDVALLCAAALGDELREALSEGARALVTG